jgi:uncharacterized protein YyaL (SSP411 family)
MKKAVLFFGILVLFAFNVKAQNLRWYQWNEGYPLAQKEGKIILVDAYTDWCGWCKKMDRDTYSNPAIIETLNKDFIAIKFNPELRDSVYKVDSVTYTASDFFNQLTRGERTGFPTTYFINPIKRSLFIDPGYHDAATFSGVLKQVLKDYK